MPGITIKVFGLHLLVLEINKTYNLAMKLICLNIWGGQVYNPLIEFLKVHSKDTDIFCFQEVLTSEKSIFSNGAKTDLSKDLEKILKDFNMYLAIPFLKGYDFSKNVDFDLAISQATFVRKNIKVKSEFTKFVYGKEAAIRMSDIKRETKRYLDVPRNIHCVNIEVNGKEILIGNLHGFWMPRAKGDSKERIYQSKKVKEIFDSFKGPKILCGDFNLRPDTKSVEMLEEDMRNLVIEYGLKSTRSRLHKRKQKFADYIMVSRDIRLKSFEAIDVDVSDHLPLAIEFTV